MDYQSFKPICAMYNESWLGRTLGLKRSGRQGVIDLRDDEFAVEMKGRSRTWYPGWVVNADQIDEYVEQNSPRPMFWAFMLYDISRTIPSITPSQVSSVIKRRNVWILPWDWIRKFPITRPPTGPYVHAHQKDLPNGHYFRRYRRQAFRQRGFIYVPKNCLLEDRLRSHSRV